MKDKELPITGFEPIGNQFGLRRFGFRKNEDGEWEVSIVIEGLRRIEELREVRKELSEGQSTEPLTHVTNVPTVATHSPPTVPPPLTPS